MIEFKVEDNCNNFDSNIQILNQCQHYILDIINAFRIETLSYFVVADMDISLYCDTVSKYSNLLNIEREVTNDESYNGAGITLEGVTEQGEYHQIIIIKSGILLGLLMDLWVIDKREFDETEEYKKVKFTAIKLVTHELGHAIDNQNMYNLSKCVETECKFNINNRDGYIQYIKQMALGLLGEYYAEYNMYQVMKNIDANTNNAEMLKECIKNYSLGDTKNQVLDRVHRILYFYMHWLAFCHSVSKKNSFNDTIIYFDEILEYRPLLENIELELLQLNKHYPDWDMEKDLETFYDKINEMVNYEVNKHIC